jgi:glycosyltransferase involved in cell wall biosynthesis
MMKGPAELSVVVISPFAHGPGHPHSFSRQVFVNLRKAGYGADVVTTLPWRDLASESEEDRSFIHAVFPLPLRWYGKLPGFLQRLFFLAVPITLLCALRALLLPRRAKKKIYHFIDGSPLVISLLGLVLNCRVVLQIWRDMSYLFEVPAEARGLKRTWFELRRRIYFRALKKQRFAFITDSQPVAEHMSGQGIETHFVRYAISDESAVGDRAGARSHLRIGSEAFACLLFGTHRFDKDYDTVFRALQSFPIPAQLLIAGQTISGPTPESLAVKYPEVSTRIEEAFIADQDAAAWFEACDVVVLPYRRGRVQGSALVYDALQYERPVITTEGGFLGDFISQYQTGFTYRDGDAEDLKRALTKISAMTLAERVTFASHLRSVKQQHGWSTRLKDYIAVY